MRRKSYIALFLSVIFIFSGVIFAEEITEFLTIKLKIGSKTAYVNNDLKALDSPPIIVNGRTMVPLRFISESLGGEVTFVKETQEIILKFTDLNKLKSKLKEQEGLNNELMTAIQKKDTDLKEKQQTIENLEAENKNLKMAKSTNEETIKQLNSDIQKKEEEIKTLKKQISEDIETINTLKADLETKKNEVEELKLEIKNKQNEIDSLKKEIEDYKKNYIKVEQKNLEIFMLGKKMNPATKPFIYNDKVMVSLEDVASELKLSYKYDKEKGKVSIGDEVSPDKPVKGKIGQRLVQEPYAITVHGKRYAGNDVIIEATIENLGNKTFSADIFLNDYEIEDKDGKRYQIDVLTTIALKNFLDGDILPGEKLRGEVAFAMDDMPGLVFWFRPSLQNVYFKIQLD